MFFQSIKKAKISVSEKKEELKGDEALVITLSVIFSVLGLGIIVFGILYWRKKRRSQVRFLYKNIIVSL